MKKWKECASQSVIDSTDSEKTEYRNSEKSVSPYPGLKWYVKIRSTDRNYCYSKTTMLDLIV